VLACRAPDDVITSPAVQHNSWPTAWGHRVFAFLVSTYFLGSVVLAWREEQPLWLATLLVLGLASLLDLLWPPARSTPKPIGWAKLALFAMAVTFVVSGGWRHFARERQPTRPAVQATALSTSPDHGGQGKMLTVTISGAGLGFTERSKLNFGPDISVLTNNVVNPTTLRADIQIAPGAPIGGRRVWISTPGRETTIDNTRDGAFQVVAAANP
jgi:hypothetical protein